MEMKQSQRTQRAGHCAMVSIRTCLLSPDGFIQALELQEVGKKQPLSSLGVDTDVFLSYELAEATSVCISS